MGGKIGNLDGFALFQELIMGFQALFVLFMHDKPVGHRKCQNVHKASKKKKMGIKIDSGRARLGKKMDQLEEYTSLHNIQNSKDYIRGWGGS